MSRVSYEIRTVKGAAICTFDSRKAAIRQAEQIAEGYPGLCVVEVTVPDPVVRRVWTEARLKLVAS